MITVFAQKLYKYGTVFYHYYHFLCRTVDCVACASHGMTQTNIEFCTASCP